MPRATPISGKSSKLMAGVEKTKLIKFELNYNNTRILIESDNKETLNEVLDVIKDTCGDKDKALRKLLNKEK